MDILETRDDEDTAISAINIVGVISVRHPQAFKTRFWVGIRHSLTSKFGVD